MNKPYDLLEGVLNEIEKNLKSDISENVLADRFSLSIGHLCRLFKFAFGRTLGSYIRSRKLAASIDDLLNTSSYVLDIAMDYGIDYEQSYIRTFKREFGLTPGELRKGGQIVKITPPLQLFDSNKLGDGLIFGPDIVIIPQFHVAGKKHKVPFRDALVVDPILSTQFYNNERLKIPDAVNPNVHINISYQAEKDVNYSYSMPSIQVKTKDNIPKEFDTFTFPTSLCANFRFISTDGVSLNMAVADGMFKAIDDFMDDERQQYFLERKRLNFEKIISSTDDGFFNQWEWFAPVIKKTELKIPANNPSGIKSVEKQEIPALRFIGKKCAEPPQPENILNLIDNWRLNGWFDVIEKQFKIDYDELFDGSGAYINLVRKKGASLEEGNSEHWMGMFVPQGAEVPQGYEAIDFPKSELAVCGVYGKRDEIVNYETKCRKKLEEEGFSLKNTKFFFRRFNWHRFFEEDIYGKRKLEYCYIL